MDSSGHGDAGLLSDGSHLFASHKTIFRLKRCNVSVTFLNGAHSCGVKGVAWVCEGLAWVPVFWGGAFTCSKEWQKKELPASYAWARIGVN